MSIRVENLTKIYGSQKAVNDISFEVNSGEIIGFLGPNGAGKTTTMKILTCYITPSSGKVVVAVLNGEFLVRRLHIQEHSISLIPENKRYGTIQVAQLEQYSTWGVVSFVIHSL